MSSSFNFNPKKRLVRVFLSSTFRDFIEERDILVKRVFPELRQFCRDRFVELVEVDLRWGITAEQSEKGEVLPICLKEITRCRPGANESDSPYFVGMLGERYGWVPEIESKAFPQELLEEQPWLKEHMGGKSVTELEILHGVLRNKSMIGKAFFYFRDPTYVNKIDNAQSKNFISEKPEEYEKLQILKSDIRDRKADFLVRENYRSPEDLGKLLLEDLKDAVKKAFPLDEVPDFHTRESLDHFVFLESRTRAYVPLDGLFEKLDQFAAGQNDLQDTNNDLDSDQAQEDDANEEDKPSLPFVIRGDSGGGKSALLASWFSNFEQNQQNIDNTQSKFDKRPFRFIHFIGGTPSSVYAESLLRRLLEEIKRYGASPSGELIATDLPGLAVQLPRWLDTLSSKGGGVLIFDALNQLAIPLERELDWLPARWPSNIRIILSVLPGDALRAMDKRGWLLPESTLVVKPLTPNEREKIALAYLKFFNKELEPKLLNHLLTAEQSKNPLFLRTVLEELRVRSSHEQLQSHLDNLLKAAGPSELFVMVLKNLEADFELQIKSMFQDLKEANPSQGDPSIQMNNYLHTKDNPGLVHRLFEVMGAAFRGLSESELLQILSPSEKPSEQPIPRSLLAPVFLALGDSLLSKDGQLSFFHDYLRQAVLKEYLDEEKEQIDSNNLLALPLLNWNKGAYSSSLEQYGHEHGYTHLLARVAGVGKPMLAPENLDKALDLIQDSSCLDAGAVSLGNHEPFRRSLNLIRETLARDKPEKLKAGVELTVLAITKPKQLQYHLKKTLESKGKEGDWSTVLRLSDVEQETDGKILAGIRALIHANNVPDPSWVTKMERLADSTSSGPEWKELIQRIKIN